MIVCLTLCPAWAEIYTVTSTADTGDAGTLRWAITQANANPGSTINVQDNLGTITVSSQAPLITAAVTINGGTGNTVSGGNAYRPFFIDAGVGNAVSINNLSIANGFANGGDGTNRGGGGMGAGGAIFVNTGNVTIANVTFSNNAAEGGKGGDSSGYTSPNGFGGGGGGLHGNGGASGSNASGGGGGFGGNGGSNGGGGGGLVGSGGNGEYNAGGGGGALGNGGNAVEVYGGGGGSPSGGAGGTYSQNSRGNGVDGGLYGGGGGSSRPGPVGGTNASQGGHGGAYGGGGGVHETSTIYSSGSYANAGNGGDFGGGGGARNGDHRGSYAGDGGYGGGGGGGAGAHDHGIGLDYAGMGGFGGGGGGATRNNGEGGAFAGSGGVVNAWPIPTISSGGGGGGAALGGNVFVRGENGATITFVDSELTDGSVTGGVAGASLLNGHSVLAAQAGQGVGSNLFLDGGNITFQITSGSRSISGTIADAAVEGYTAGGITKTGAGTLSLLGDNTYAGVTTVSAGTLQIGNGGTTGSVIGNLTNNGELVINRSGSWNYAGSITGPGSLTSLGAGTLTFSGASSLDGGLSVRGGTLIFTNSVTSTGVGSLADNGGTAALQVSGSGASWTNQGDILIGHNGGTGDLLISAGGTASDTFALVGRTADSTGNVTVTGTGSTWTHSSGLVVGTGGIGTMLVSAGGQVSNADGWIGGDAGSSGTVTITGENSAWTSNDYLIVGGGGTGVLTVADSATVKVGSTGTGMITLGNSGAGAGTLNMGAVAGQTAIAPGMIQAAAVTAGSGSGPNLVNFNHTGTGYTFAPDLTGNLRVEHNGSGRTLLAGANTYSGPTMVNSGTLQFTKPTAISAGMATNLTVASGAAAVFNLGGANDFTDSQISAIVAAANFQSGSSLGFDISNAPDGDYTFGGTLVGSLGFQKAGAGTLTLTGNNTYTGPITLAGGSLVADHANALGANGVINFTGGTLQISASNLTDYSSRFSQAAGQQYRIDTHGQNVTLATALASAGGTFEKLGGGTLTLTGENTFNGAVSITNGTLQIGNGTIGSLAAVNVVNDGTLVINSPAVTALGPISGTGAFTKLGDNTLTLASANTYTGVTTLAGGAVRFTDRTSLYNANSADWTAANLIVNPGASAIFNVGGASGFTSSDITALAALGTANSGFRSGSILGIDTTNAGGSFLLSSAIADPNGGANSLSLSKLGTGTLTLTGANTYTGGTTISAGTLVLTPTSFLADTGALQVNGGTFNLGQNHPETIGALTVSSGAVTGTGSSALTVSSLAGSAGSIQLSSLTSTQTGETTFSGQLISTRMILSGSGTLTLAGANNNTGATATVNSGVLVLAKSGTPGFVHAIGDGLTINNGGTVRLGGSTNDQIYWNAPIVVNTGGTLDLNGRNESLGSFALDGTVTNTATGTASTLTLGENQGGSATFSGTFQDGGGTLALNLIGSGTITLSGSNTNTGGITITNGTLAIAANERLADTGAMNVNGGTFNLGTFDETVGALTLTSGTIAGTGRLSASSYAAHSGTIAALLGSGAFTKTGAGTLTFSGSSSRSIGALIANDGTITGGGPLTVASLAGSAGNVQFSSLTSTQSGDTTFSGQLNQTQLILSGSGTLTLDGSGDNYLASATVNSGVLTLAKGDTAGTHAIGSGLTINNGGIVRLGGSTNNQIFWNAPVIVNTGGTFDLNGRNEGLGELSGSGIVTNTAASTFSTLTLGEENRTSTFAGTMQDGDGLLALVKTRTGTLTLSGSNTYTGGTTITGGTLALGASHVLADTGAVTLTGGTLNLGADRLDAIGTLTLTNGTVTGTGTSALRVAGLSGSGGVVQLSSLTSTQTGDTTFSGQLIATPLTLSGPGTLTLAGNQDNAGASATVNAGVLVLAKTTGGGVHSLGDGLTINSGGTVRLAGSTGNQIYWNAPIVVNTGGTLDLNGRNESLGSFTGGGLVTNSATGTASTLILGENFGGSTTFSGSMQDGHGTLALRMIGGGTLTLTGNNTYTGGTTINSGTLSIGDGAATGSITGNIANNAALIFNRSGSLDYAGAISGSGSLTKLGDGTLTLTGNNTYTGATSVTAGTLLVNGSLANTNVTVASGATLGGSGSIDGFTTLQSGARLAPGTSPGTLTFTNGLGLVAGAILDFELGSNSDRIDVTGGLLSGPANGLITLNLLNAGDFDFAADGSYTLFNFLDGGTSSFDVADFTFGSLLAGTSIANYAFDLTSTSLILNYTASAIPEPSTYAVLAGALALGLATWRKKRTAAPAPAR